MWRVLLLLAYSGVVTGATVRIDDDGTFRLSVQCGVAEKHAQHFSTLLAARDELRSARQLHRGTSHAAVIEVGGQCNGLELGPQDADVSWQGVKDADGRRSAVISGGLPLPPSAFGVVSDPAVLKLLPKSAHGRVQQLNLTALGLTPTDIGKLLPHFYPGGNAQIDFFKLQPSGAAELFWGDLPLHRARYPNSEDDQLLIPANSMRIHTVVRGAGGIEGNRAVLHNGSSVALSRLKSWAAEIASGRDLWAHGEWSALGWADTHKPVVSVEPGNGTVTTAWRPPPTGDTHSEGKSQSGGWFRIYNAVSELDAPSEYVIGTFGASLLLLVFPPVSSSGVRIAQTVQPVLSVNATAALVNVHDTHNVTFSGIDIAVGRSWGAVFNNCDDCGISDSSVRNFGINGVNVTGGHNFLLRDVEVTGTGQGGVILQGGNRTTLTPANHSVINCRIHHFARIMQKYTPGLCLCGVGHSIRNSTIRDGAHFGMMITGNDHTISGNLFTNLVYGGADAGAIYSGRDWTYRGQMISDNRFENISSLLCQPGGGGTCTKEPPRALHLDDGMSGWTIVRNHFVNVTQVYAGMDNRDITFANNTIVHVNTTYLTAAKRAAINEDVLRSCTNGSHSRCTQRSFLRRVPYDCAACAWRKYPHLADILADGHPNLPKHWIFENNTYCDISFNGISDRPLMNGDFDPNTTFTSNTGNANSSACLRP